MMIEIGKRYVFNTTDAELQKFNGTTVEIVRQLTKKECDNNAENVYEAKFFINGYSNHVYESELIEETKEIKVKTKGGYLWATNSGDIDYPGIDVEFVADNEDENAVSRPRIVFEHPKDGRLRILVWDDKNNEDYTREIVFNIEEREDVDTNRVYTVMKALKVEKEDALKIIEHLTVHDCLEWIDDYKEENRSNELLVDVHYENTFEDMINWQYEDYKPSDMLGLSEDIRDHEEMLQLSNKVIFWYGLV